VPGLSGSGDRGGAGWMGGERSSERSFPEGEEAGGGTGIATPGVAVARTCDAEPVWYEGRVDDRCLCFRARGDGWRLADLVR